MVLVETLMRNNSTLGCRMFLKIHFPDDHLDRFKENIRTYLEDQVQFHLVILNLERRYQEWYNGNMIGDDIR